MSTFAPSRRGHPPVSPVDTLRTMAWFNALSLQSGLTATELERELEPHNIRLDDTGRTVGPRKWSRYQRGANVPRDVRNGPVEIAEAAFPGSAFWFRHPLWAALRELHLDCQATLDALNQLPEIVRAGVLQERLPPEHPIGMQPLVVVDEVALNDLLARIDPLDAVAVASIYSRRAEAIGSVELRELAIGLYCGVQPRLAIDRRWASIHCQLLDLVDARMKLWVFPDAGRRLDAMIFWRARRGLEWPSEARLASEAVDVAHGTSIEPDRIGRG